MAKINKSSNKRAKNNSFVEGIQLNHISLFVMITLYIIIRTFITRRLGLSAASYVYSAVDFIMIFILLVPFAIKHTLSKRLYQKFRAGQYINVKRLMYAAYMSVTIYSVLSILILWIFKNTLCHEVLISKCSMLSLEFLLPSIFFSGISSVCLAYFLALNADRMVMLLQVIEKILMFLGVVILSNVFNSYGLKVSNVLMNQEYHYAFGAAGAALGLSVGIMISTIINFVCYRLNAYHMNKKSVNVRVEHITEIISWLKSELFKFSAPFVFVMLYPVIAQAFYFRQMETVNENELMSYQWGSFSGVFFTFLIFPAMWLMYKSFIERDDISLEMRSGNNYEVRLRVTEILENSFKVIIPIFVFIFVAGPYFIRGFLSVDSDLSVRILRTGAINILVCPLLIVSINILQALLKPMMAMLNGIISLILGVASLIILITIMKSGLYGVTIAVFITFLVNAFLNLSSIIKLLHIKFDINNNFTYPVFSSTISGFVTMLLGLLLNLFLLPVIIAIVLFIVFTFIIFVLYCKTGIVTYNSLNNALFGNFWGGLGYRLNLFKGR